MENEDIKTEPEPNSDCVSSTVCSIKIEDSSSIDGVKLEDSYNNMKIKVDAKDIKPAVKLEPDIKPDEILTNGIDQDGCDISNDDGLANLPIQNKKSTNIARRIEEFSCNECRLKTCSECNFKRHTGKNFKSFNFKNKPYRNRSLEMHQDFHVCDLCNFKTADKSNLMQHARIHRGIRSYSCNFCNYKAGTNGALRVHIRKVHNSVNSFACSLCKFKFVKKYCLDEHIRRFHNASNLCDLKTLQSIDIQHTRIHKSEKPFTCI